MPDIRDVIRAWIREDAPLTVKMTLYPEHVQKLVDRLAATRDAGTGRDSGEADNRRLPFNMDQRAQAAVLADLPPSVAQEAGEFYENAGAPRQASIKKRDAMAVAWQSVLRPYLIGLRDQHAAQARPEAGGQSLLRPVGPLPAGCYCSTGLCMAPRPEWCRDHNKRDAGLSALADPSGGKP